MSRRYPDGLTEAQKKMMRKVERGKFEPTAREQARLTRLVKKGCLVKKRGWYEHAPDLLPQVTYFIEESYGNIKIGVATSTRIVERLQLSHPRELKLLGAFKGNRLSEIRKQCDKHHVENGWYKPHVDVLSWTQKKDFHKDA